MLYDYFSSAYLILIDPTKEAKEYANNNLSNRNFSFYECGVGEKSGELKLNVEKETGYSSFLEATDINFRGEPVDKRIVKIKTLDNIITNENKLGRIGVKIDTEGYELNVIKGASRILNSVNFVLAEVRHNHKSFEDLYNLSDFVKEMQKNDFILSMIITAKPFIADLCFQPRKLLSI